MIEKRAYQDLGAFDNAWLKARYHFSFADYYDVRYRRFGHLRVINDDVIQPQSGFDTHGHQHMEIITIVRQGVLTHTDNQGNRGQIHAGDIQIMRAGDGIFHAEYNLGHVPVVAYQIWILPREKGGKPQWEQWSNALKASGFNQWQTIVTDCQNQQDAKVLGINQASCIRVGHFEVNHVLEDTLRYPYGYLLVHQGRVQLADGTVLSAGDGAMISEQLDWTATVEKAASLVLIETV